jgi:uncharacterized Tic20 family protein
MSEIETGSEENQTPDSNNQSAGQDGQPSEQTSSPSSSLEKETNQWAMFIHFSILAGWVVPLAGLIVPIILWQLKKDELPGIIPHVHVVLNWIVTSLVYAVICFILTFVLIGILGFIALAIATVVFSVIGGLKANEGIVWEYPGTFIRIFK